MLLVLVLAPLMLQVLKSACDMMGLKGALPKVDLNQPLQCRMPKSAVWCLHGVCVCACVGDSRLTWRPSGLYNVSSIVAPSPFQTQRHPQRAAIIRCKPTTCSLLLVKASRWRLRCVPLVPPSSRRP